MGQWDIYSIFKTNPKDWLTSRDIAEILQLSTGSVQSGLKRLRKSGLIEAKIETGGPFDSGRRNKNIMAYRYIDDRDALGN